MGFREMASGIAVKAFDVFGNVQQSCTYRSKTSASPVYDPSTGAPSGGYTDIPISMIFTSFRLNEIDKAGAEKTDEIRKTDMKALVPSQRLPVTPKMNDIVILNAESWEVLRVKQDPAGALWTFQLRKP
jgi:hypothetical protein